MFVIQKDKKIILTKGDTATLHVKVIDLEGKEYKIKNDDVITMTIRRTPNSNVAIQKIASSKQYIILEPSDTKALSTGLYVYDVQLQTGDNIYTIVPMSYFEIRSEVTT